MTHINEDFDLVIRLKNKDEEAFRLLFNKYFDKLYYFSYRYLRSKEESEELVQEIFLKIWENRKDINPEFSFNNYLFKITKNSLFNINRKKINEKAYIEYVGNFVHLASQNKNEYTDAKNFLEIVNKHIDELPEQQRKVIKLSRFDGYSYKEISEKLNISVRTVEVHLRLATKTIKEKIGSLSYTIIFIIYLILFKG